MSELKFNSQIATTIEQSKRLLELGLNPETADMYIDTYFPDEPQANVGGDITIQTEMVPAWSLHRLLCMIPNVTDDDYWAFIMDNIHCLYNSPIDGQEDFEKGETIFDNIIRCIEWLIKDNYFNKKYLKEKI